MPTVIQNCRRCGSYDLVPSLGSIDLTCRRCGKTMRRKPEPQPQSAEQNELEAGIFTGFIALVFSSLAILGFYSALLSFRAEATILRLGTAAQATVVQVTESQRTRTRYVTYRYSLTETEREIRQWTRSDSMSFYQYEQIFGEKSIKKIDSVIRIKYLPSNPSVAIIVLPNDSWYELLERCFMLLFMVLFPITSTYFGSKFITNILLVKSQKNGMHNQSFRQKLDQQSMLYYGQQAFLAEERLIQRRSIIVTLILIILLYLPAFLLPELILIGANCSDAIWFGNCLVSAP